MFGAGAATLTEIPTIKGRRNISDSLHVLSNAIRVFYSLVFADCMTPPKEILTGLL